MRTFKKISIIVLLLTVSVWSAIPSGLVLAAEESLGGNQTETVQLETPVEIVPTELDNSGNEPVDIKPIPDKPIKPVKPDQIIPDNLSPTNNQLVPDENEREPRDPLDEENPVDTYADRDNAGLQPKNNGQYSVDEFTGVFSYSYPIQIPAGRNGLQPSLALQYNHRLNNIDSMVGVGWQLTMPNIERSNRTGIDNLYIDNYFRLNLGVSDDLIAIDVDGNGYGIYGKQIESDFLKIEFNSNNQWIVTDKLGVVYTFGSTAASRQDNPSDNSQVYKWLLEEIRDTNDNFVRYEYYKDSGQIYPKKIFYTGHGSTDGIFEVDFEPFANSTPTENNVDNISYQTGFGVATKYLLDNIDIKINGDLVTRYDLDLNLNGNDNKYLLDRIIPRFYQDGSDYVKDQVEFDYSASVNTYKEGEGYELPYPLGVGAGLNSSKRDMFVDLNGDSYTDYLRFLCTSGTVSLSVWLNDTDDGWVTSTAYSNQQLETGVVCSGPGSIRHSIPVAFANIDGDHFIDMITDDTVYYNNDSSWDTASTTLPISLYYSSGSTTPPMPVVIFQDMNADGYDDIVYEHHPNNGQSDVDVYIKDQSSGEWNLDNNFHLSVNQPNSECLIYGGSPIDFKDFNGDGLLDVFYKYYCRYGVEIPAAEEEQIYLNSGYNFTTTTLYSAPITPSYFHLGGGGSNNVDYFTDLNDDGLQDYGYYNRSLDFYASNWILSESVILDDKIVFSSQIGYGGSIINTPPSVAIADINGDKIQDVIHNPSNFEIYYGQGIKPDILTEVDYQSGAKVNVYYESSAKEKDQYGNLLNPDLPFDLQVVKEVVVNNGQQDWQGYQYEYKDGNTTSYLDQNIKDLHGFSEISVKSGKAMPDIDFGTGVDGNYVSSGNETWTTNKNFTSLTIQSGDTITVEPQVVIKVQGDVVIDGVITAQGHGYTGGGQLSWAGESGDGPGGGGGGYGGTQYVKPAGGGAGYADLGEDGQGCSLGYCTGGVIYGNELLDGIDKGSGGGGSAGDHGVDGGNGGGIIQLFGKNIIVNGEINSDGDDGENGQDIGNTSYGGSGGGSGGSIYLKALESITINGSIHANGGQGGSGSQNNSGGDGSDGRIRIESPQINGNTSPDYYTKGDFDYSIDNTPTDNDLQKQISYYHTAEEDGLYLHGKPFKSELVDSNKVIQQINLTDWQEEQLSENRKFVFKDHSSNSKVKIGSEEEEFYEFSIDGGTRNLWHFNGAEATSGKIRDEVGSSDFLEYGNPTASLGLTSPGNEGAYYFDGNGDYLMTQNDFPDFYLGSFTIETWFKTDQMSPIVTQWEESNQIDSYHIEINSLGHPEFFIMDQQTGQTRVISGNVDLRDNQWHYLAAVKDASEIRLYIDGELVANTNVSNYRILSNSKLKVSMGHNGGYYGDVDIDELRVSSIARTGTEIYNYYHTGLAIDINIIEHSKAKQYSYDLTNGNLLEENDLGKVELDINTGEITDQLIGDEKQTTYDYAFNSNEHILSAPKTKIISNSVESKQQNLYYDNLPLGQVNTVNLTKEDYIVNQVDIDRNFNSYGLVTTQTDPKGFNTTISYDSYNFYPSQTTNPLNQITQTQYNLLNGQLATSTSPNGMVSVNKYDAFGRIKEVWISDPSNPNTLIKKQQIDYQDSQFPRYKTVYDFIDGEIPTSTEPEIDSRIDAHTIALWHMNGDPDTIAKKDNAEGVMIYDLVEYNNPSSSSGFDGTENGGYELLYEGNHYEYLRPEDGDLYLPHSDPLTIEAWVKVNDNGLRKSIVTASDDNRQFAIDFMAHEDGRFFAEILWSYNNYQDQAQFGVTSNSIIDDGQWHYVALVMQNNPYAQLKLYTDGQLDNEATHAFLSYDFEQLDYGWYLGILKNIGNDSVSHFYDGDIDEVRISNIARTSQEIEDYYTGIIGGGLALDSVRYEDTGWKSPTITGEHFNQFSNPENSYISDDLYATSSDSGAGGSSRTQSYEGFDFGIPLDAQIKGIEVQVEHKVNDIYAVGETVKIYSASEGMWSDYQNLTVSTSDYLDLVGAPDYTWGFTPTASDFNLNNFSVYYKGAREGAGNTTWSLDDIKVKVYYEITHSDAVISREYSNGLDQVIQKKTQMANTDEYSTVDIDYDSLGRVIRQSLPYITNTLDYTEADIQQSAKTYSYDALDRVLTETTPVGTTSYEYDGLTTKIYDANDHRKDLTKDAYGNLVEVKEYNDSNIYTTDYEYNLTNQLTKITDAQGNERNFIYDALGNLTSQDMVHISGAENVPVMTYTYDKNGNVVNKTNFNGQITYYTYDKLNRPVVEKSGGLYQIQYKYDQGGQSNIGQLTQVDYLGGNRQNYNYDILGRLIDYDSLIEGETYNLDYDYNLSGQLLTVTYPDGKQVNYNLNNIGQLNEVVYDDGQGQTSLANNIQYNANGQLTDFTRNNGYQTSYTYNPDQNYRLSNLTTTDSQNTIQDISYTYDPVGNIIELVDDSGGDLAKTVSYTYDDLNRLLVATADYTNNTSSDYAISYTYDSVGNMTYNSQLGVLAYDYDQPHQVSEVNNIDYAYDDAGNLLFNGNVELTWDYKNRLIYSLDSSEYPVYYQYDSNNQRLVKTQFKDDGQGGIGTLLSQNHYLDKYFEKDLVADNTKDHIYLGNMKLATVNDNNDPYFIIGDHLNSSSILVDSTGNLSQVTDYLPYGSINYEDTIQDLGDDYTFTGKEKDEENGLQYFGARYLDNEIGRFVSMDSVSLNLHDPEQLKNLSNQQLESILSNPQLLNSYSYSANNPIVYTDPDGNFLDTFLDIGFIAYDVYKIAQSYAQTGQVNQEYVKSLSLDSVGVLIPGATGLGMVGRIASKADNAVDAVKAVKVAEQAANTASDANKYIDNIDDIIPQARQNHILNGDVKGGGHKFGAGKGKPEFPSSWSDKQIFHNAADIATDPSLNWSRQRDGRWFVSGIRDNVNMKVIIDPTKSHIITAFPKIK